MRATLPTAPAEQHADFDGTSRELISANELRLLAAIGFFAAKSGCLAVAIRIFESLCTLRPGTTFPFIGLAVAYMVVGMDSEAVYVLRDRGVRECKDDNELRLWLALAYHQSGNHAQAIAELQAWLKREPAEASHPLAERLSRLLGSRPMKLDWPSPAPISEVPEA